jgi:hypothetical protein
VICKQILSQQFSSKQASSLPQMHSRTNQQQPAMEHFKPLIEEIVADECNLVARGLFFSVDELELVGHPPDRIRVWATLHFLQLGSPFCDSEPQCHLTLFLDRLERVNDAVRHRLHLLQEVQVEFVAINATSHEGVEFDDPATGRPPSLDWHDIDRRDGLGRTTLMRAVERGHEQFVEELLEAGADPFVRDREGRTMLEKLREGQTWLRTVLEAAVGKGIPIDFRLDA